MTQEEKQMLFDDISRRLSCGVIVHHKKINVDYKVNGVLVNEKSDGEKELLIYVKTLDNGIQLPPTGPGDVLLYLRPMSSMTEEERKHFESKCCWGKWESGPIITLEVADWLNENHFDYRGLIERGLALEATEGMYNTK